MEAVLMGATDSRYEEPRSFREAWDHPDKDARNNGEKLFGMSSEYKLEKKYKQKLSKLQ